MGVLTIVPGNRACPFNKGETLLDVLRRHGVDIETPCRGKGICGKCKVQIISGEANPPTEEEFGHLTEDELKEGIRLSCLAVPSGDLTVRMLESQEQGHQILSDGDMPDLKMAPVLSKRVWALTRPTLDHNLAFQDIVEGLGDSRLPQDDPAFLRALPDLFREEEATAVYAGEALIGVEPGDTRGQMYGLAVDIGTTTIVMSLVDVNTGRELGSETAINPQKEYGLDVLSRIEFVRRKAEGLELLQAAIRDCLNRLTGELCRRTRISRERIYEISVAANATMMHLLLGVDTNSIGKSPFVTVFSRSQYFPAATLGLSLSPFARLYCLPGVSSYIGADIVAGVAVSQLKTTRNNVLFIDIGTNCELVLSKGGELSSCSCAAGPALEGMNISCGMRAAQGAIERVSINNHSIHCGVIGGGRPSGLCGSGILEAISEILRVGLIGKNGRIRKREDLKSHGSAAGLSRFLAEEEGKRKILLDPGHSRICVTQGDIRQVQLAKGAILSGVRALLELMALEMDDLDEVIIAGQFGKHLSVESLVGVGILPAQLTGKIRYIGNASKTGALMCLLSRETRQAMETIAQDIHYFELSTKEGYERLFTRCLTFN